MSDRLDRIEKNIEKITDNVQRCTETTAAFGAKVETMTSLMQSHVKEDLTEHRIINDRVRLNEINLTKIKYLWVGGSAVVAFIVGLITFIIKMNS